MSYVEPHMREGLSKHRLELHVDSPALKAYYLRSIRGGRMMSTYVVFSVEGIVIMGDLCPHQNGVISILGYDVLWFASRLSESYLCEKFLRKEWVPQRGYTYVKEEILRGRRDDRISKEQARDSFDQLDLYRDELSNERAYEIFQDAGLQDFEGGYGYNPGDAGWLCAIQQRFSQLMHAQWREERLGTFATNQLTKRVA